jgi:co-chaperonin GroES (HSP10)
MSKNFLEPAGSNILVVDNPHVDTIIDGIIQPDNVRQQEMVFGTVVFVGPDAKRTQVENVICYGPYAGKTVAFEGIEFRLLSEGQIELYLRKSN